MAAARRAFDSSDWSRDHAFRAHCLRQLHEALIAHVEEMRTITVAEAGAPIMLTRGGPQLEAPVEMLRWHADLLDSYSWTEDLGVAESVYGSHRRWIEREAAGVVAAITPYNFPTQINLAKLAPALAAGCTVVLKGAPDTPWSALALGRLIAERTDIPAGVVNVLSSSGAAVGEALTTHPGVDMVSFTGSTAVGRRGDGRGVGHRQAGVPGARRHKSAYVVLDDADIGTVGLMAAAMVWHPCRARAAAITTRLVVPVAMHDTVVDAVGATLDGHALRRPDRRVAPDGTADQRAPAGQGRGPGGHGPVRGGCGGAGRAAARAPAPRLLLRADGARRRWARTTPSPSRRCSGPVLSVIAYDGGDDEAVRIANNSEFGLSGAVASADPERARAVARRIRTGTVSVNGGVYYGPDAPFGGYKQSGLGREMGVAGVRGVPGDQDPGRAGRMREPSGRCPG